MCAEAQMSRKKDGFGEKKMSNFFAYDLSQKNQSGDSIY